MWSLNPLPEFTKRADRFKKKWGHEIANVLINLATLLKSLNFGAKSEQLKQLGFVHSEPMGILAVDQKGKGKGAKLKPFRLYVFADERSKTLHLMTLGDKDSQEDDIRQCKSFVEGLLQSTAAIASETAKDGASTETSSQEKKQEGNNVSPDADD